MHLTKYPELPHTPVELALLVFKQKITIPDGFLRHKGSLHSECAGILVKSMRDIHTWERRNNVSLGKEGLFAVMHQVVDAAGVANLSEGLEMGELAEHARQVAHRAKNLMSAGKFTVPQIHKTPSRRSLVPSYFPI